MDKYAVKVSKKRVFNPTAIENEAISKATIIMVTAGMLSLPEATGLDFLMG